MSDDELDDLEEAMDEQRDALYEALGEDLDEHRAGREHATDGGRD